MALNVKPLGDRLLVEPAEEKEVKKGGIIIPDTAKEKPQEGIIIALGPAKPTTTARSSRLKSRRATAFSSANTAALKSNSTARNTKSSARTTFWPSSANHSQLSTIN
jgi:co-chaperonin GroES (HSP10)